MVEDEIVGVISTMVALLSCRGRKKMKYPGRLFLSGWLIEQETLPGLGFPVLKAFNGGIQHYS